MGNIHANTSLLLFFSLVNLSFVSLILQPPPLAGRKGRRVGGKEERREKGGEEEGEDGGRKERRTSLGDLLQLNILFMFNVSVELEGFE